MGNGGKAAGARGGPSAGAMNPAGGVRQAVSYLEGLANEFRGGVRPLTPEEARGVREVVGEFARDLAAMGAEGIESVAREVEDRLGQRERARLNEYKGRIERELGAMSADKLQAVAQQVAARLTGRVRSRVAQAMTRKTAGAVGRAVALGLIKAMFRRL